MAAIAVLGILILMHQKNLAIQSTNWIRVVMLTISVTTRLTLALLAVVRALEFFHSPRGSSMTFDQRVYNVIKTFVSRSGTLIVTVGQLTRNDAIANDTAPMR